LGGKLLAEKPSPEERALHELDIAGSDLGDGGFVRSERADLRAGDLRLAQHCGCIKRQNNLPQCVSVLPTPLFRPESYRDERLCDRSEDSPMAVVAWRLLAKAAASR